MKKILLPFAAISFLIACNNAPDADTAATGEKQDAATTTGAAFAVDSTTTVTWTGSKPTGTHIGTFRVNEGSLLISDNQLTGGKFVIDINSLNNTDLAGDAENKGKLEGHLKSPDFFDAAKFATATFEITGVEPFKADSSATDILLKDATHTIKGNFTLKDSTKNISFPAKVTIAANNVTAVADFNIDRTLWGLNYKGPNNPADWFISKTVNIKLNVSASKK